MHVFFFFLLDIWLFYEVQLIFLATTVHYTEGNKSYYVPCQKHKVQGWTQMQMKHVQLSTFFYNGKLASNNVDKGKNLSKNLPSKQMNQK